MKRIKFDFNSMFDHSIGRKHGVSSHDMAAIKAPSAAAVKHLREIASDKDKRVRLGLEWMALPYQGKEDIARIASIGDMVAKKYKNVISLGIGGSYLGLKAAQDALRTPYYNDFSKARRGRPRFYFDGNNLDPETMHALLSNLDPRETFVTVISKSGETTETKAAFAVIEAWLIKSVGKHYGRQIFVITDPESGTLRKKVMRERSMDQEAFHSLPVMKGVGGRFSELNIGLLHMAIVGIDIQEVLDGAKDMSGRCLKVKLSENPALMYASLHTVLHRKKGKGIAVMMPFSELLSSTADWYVQLLAESLGKKYSRKVTRDKGGERWQADRGKVVNAGRTPIPSRGTNDLHSIQQNNIEGPNDKVTTFIKVEEMENDIRVAGTGDILSGKSYSSLLSLAREATEWALSMESRPSCTITLPRLSPFYWGGLIYFFEMATALEGELINVNAFDQPGVESYKNYLYYKLGKGGIPPEIINEIRDNPLKKDGKFIM